jgi:hypothetical protein
MHRTRRPARRALTTLAWTLLAGWGCRPPPPSAAAPSAAAPAEAAADPGRAAVYSPFAVQVAGSFWIDTITFKDVGLRLQDAGSQALVYEAFAAALALALVAHEAQAAFEPTVADPRWHTMCAGRHLYVDVWQSEAPRRLGYSLWSGCGADDRLAWVEVPLATPVGADPLAAAMLLAAEVTARIDPCPSVVCG